MEVKTFTLSFVYDGKKHSADCTRMVIEGYKRPMLRVSTGTGLNPEVYIFWEMEDLSVFWHPLPPKKQKKALHISYALMKYLNPKYRKPRAPKTLKK